MKYRSFSPGNRVICSLGWPQTVSVAKAGLQFLILLPPMESKCWDSRKSTTPSSAVLRSPASRQPAPSLHPTISLKHTHGHYRADRQSSERFAHRRFHSKLCHSEIIKLLRNVFTQPTEIHLPTKNSRNKGITKINVTGPPCSIFKTYFFWSVKIPP